MKTHSALVLVGLAISFVVPTFAQQKDAANPSIAQQRDLVGDPTALDEFGVLATQQNEAFTNKDAAAVAALFTEDAVLVAPDGIFPVGRRLRRGMKTRSSSGLFTFFNDLRDRHLKAIDDAVWSFGEWWGTLQCQTGLVFVNGYFSAIYIRESDAWKIRMLTLTERPRLASSPAR